MDKLLTFDRYRSIREQGRLERWPFIPEHDITQRLFEDHRSYTEVIVKDLIAELSEHPTHFAVTDLRGAGYYGPYHELLLAETVQRKLKSAVSSARPTAVSSAATQILPLLFARLIQDDAACSLQQAFQLFARSRLYGYITFPACIYTAEHPEPAPTPACPSQRQEDHLSLSPDSGNHTPAPGNRTPAQHPSRHHPTGSANHPAPVVDVRDPMDVADVERAGNVDGREAQADGEEVQAEGGEAQADGEEAQADGGDDQPAMNADVEEGAVNKDGVHAPEATDAADVEELVGNEDVEIEEALEAV
ncbi:hypothetical protein A4X13_0g5897 [Tilletia indica]|uniref:Restriction of telomere capping protein 4 C-terminal domain-containing protein n=1 Tax=Tilletia indica TaxID=43049 RepID=A0A177SXM7_9BASI|nr:hypothetical protein A4X13_0g5897 [Tilletia indica]